MPVLLSKEYPKAVQSIEDEISIRLKANDVESFIAIVPTKRKLREVQRDYLRIIPGGVTSALSLFTIETMALEIFRSICPPRHVVTGSIQAVLLHEAIRSVEPELRYFHLRRADRTLSHGTFQKILNVINHLKGHGAYVSALHGELEGVPGDEQRKLRDLALIYEAYEMQLGDHYVDSAGLLKDVNACWDEHSSVDAFRSRFPMCDGLFVFGFDEFSDPELSMLYNLSRIKGIGTLISFDYHPDNDEVFGHLKDNYTKFLEMGFRKTTALMAPSITFRDHVARHLCTYRPETLQPLECSDSVTIVRAEDREQEIELIARLIKQLVIENPSLDPSKICVSMFQPQPYTALMRETFARFGIPVNITDRYHLDQSPVVVSILSLLAIQRYHFRLSDIMRALSSPFIQLTNGDGRLDTGNLYEVASKLKIEGGMSFWLKRIDQRRREIEDQSGRTEDEFDGDLFRRESAKLERARRDLTSLAAILEKFNASMTPQEFRDRLMNVLQEVHVIEQLLDAHDVREEALERHVRAHREFLVCVDDLVDMLSLERKQNSKAPLAFYMDRLRRAISEVRYNIRQKYGHGVLVTSLDETRGLQMDVMIIAGLVDGEFPPMYQPETLFTPSRRDHQERYHLRKHRYLFYQALTNFSQRLYLTYPSRNGDKEVVPSSFLDSLLDIVEVNDLRTSPPDQFVGGIYSEDALLLEIGSRIGRDADLPPAFLPSKRIEQIVMDMRRAGAIERSRAGGTELPEYDGKILRHLGADARLQLSRFRERVYSVTQLESYGSCPFQFLAERVLRLNVTQEPEGKLSPLERGDLLHTILYEFYIRRRETNLPLLSACTSDEFAQATRDLIELSRERIDKLQIHDLFWDVEKEALYGSDHRKGVLREYLEVERERELDVRPSYFELRFGPVLGSLQHADPLFRDEAPVVAGNVKLRGKVDRVDLGENLFTIVDYKSGKTIANRSEIELGISLQLPLYLYAVEAILANRGDHRRGVAGVYYTLRSPVKEQLGIGSMEHLNVAFHASKQNRQLTTTDEELREYIRQGVTFINSYVDNIAMGNFPVEPKLPEKVCVYCDFKTVCRIRTKITIHQDSESEGEAS